MRSIIDIEVQDEKFKEFVRQFDAYQDNLKSQGGLWDKQGKAIKGANAQLKSLAALADELSEGIDSANKNQEKLRKSTDQSNRSMSNLARNTRDVAKGILSATTMLLKWSGIATAIGGLLGAGGLFGMNRLAGNISSQQKSASGLGITYGASKAFGPAFNRFLDDPQGLLQKMAEYKSSSAGMAEFAKMGITGYESKSPDELAIEVMKRASEFYKKTPKNLLSNYAEAYGFSGVLNLEELRLLGTTKDMDSQIGVFGSEKKRLNLMGGVTSPFQDYTDQMAFSGAAIEATFGKALSGLVPQLTRLSEAFRKAVDVFMRSDLVKGALDSLEKGLGNLAGYLTSPQFLNDMDEFLETTQKLAQGFKKILGTIPGIDMGPSEGLQMRRAERNFGLPSGSLEKFRKIIQPNGYSMSEYVNQASMTASVLANPGRMREGALREYLGNLIAGQDYKRLKSSVGAPGERGYEARLRYTREVDAAVNRGLIELQVINATGGNAAVSLNGMVAQ